jgi:hypothetical protein
MPPSLVAPPAAEPCRQREAIETSSGWDAIGHAATNPRATNPRVAVGRRPVRYEFFGFSWEQPI